MFSYVALCEIVSAKLSYNVVYCVTLCCIMLCSCVHHVMLCYGTLFYNLVLGYIFSLREYAPSCTVKYYLLLTALFY